MKRNIAAIVIAVSVLTAAALACGGSFSTASIRDAYMTSDAKGDNRTSAYSPDAIFYAQVDLQNAPDDTQLKAVWFAVNAEGVEPNFQIEETEFTSGDGLVNFQLSNDSLWPAGQYKVDVYLNSTLSKTLTFDVQ